MLSRGAETEIYSNIPSSLLHEEQTRKQEAKIRKFIEESHAISNELYSQSGSEIVRTIGMLLENSINELLSFDNLSNNTEIVRLLAESKAYIKLIEQLSFKVNIGKKYANAKLKNLD